MTRFRTAALGAALLALATPAAAYAGTTLGSAPAPADHSCATPADVVQVTRPDGTSARVPASGVITSWSVRAGTQAASVGLRTYRPGADPAVFTVAEDSGPSRTVAAGSGLVTFPARVKVWGDEYLGVRTDTVGAGACIALPSTSQVRVSAGGAPTAPGGQLTTVATSGEISISAVLEPDRDNDGYGDETQDGCPSYPTVQTPCPSPDTVLLSKPRKSSRAPVAKIRFASTVPGAFFVCRLDGETVEDCSSPARFRCLEPGKHRFLAYAVIDKLRLDTTPLKVRFRLPADRRGC